MKKTLVLLVTFCSLAILFMSVYLGPKAKLYYSFFTEGTSEIDHRLIPEAAEMQWDLLENRALHDGQLDIEEIHSGDILVDVNNLSESKILIVKKPYYLEGECKFDYVWWENGKAKGTFIWTDFCSDSGLVEYNGPFFGWNPTNYIKASDDTPLSTDDVQEAIKYMRPEP